MKFKTDANLPVEAAAVLRDAGYDALTVWDENLDGSDDETIASHVRLEARVLITLDLDFAAALKERSPVRELWIVEKDRIRYREGN